ncbi:MAG: NAD-dependent epimerase/dehydratase family protein, partial [Acidimicrobiales bacterium]
MTTLAERPGPQCRQRPVEQPTGQRSTWSVTNDRAVPSGVVANEHHPNRSTAMTPTEPATKTVTIIGSTGLIGTQLVRNLTVAGHRVVEVSQDTRADVLTGEGLDVALAGSDVVIDVVNSATPDDSAQGFFEQTSANLSEAAVEAGVGHYVVLSIVGADLVAPIAGYMRGKLA